MQAEVKIEEVALVATTMLLTAKIVSAHVSNNAVAASELPGVIGLVRRALDSIATPVAVPVVAEQVPAVTIRKSVTPDYLICLEDGKKLKMLKRHLATTYGMTPDDYRSKWKLPPGYPMVARNYAEKRSSLARAAGLGRKPAPVVEAAPVKKVGRPKKSAA